MRFSLRRKNKTPSSSSSNEASKSNGNNDGKAQPDVFSRSIFSMTTLLLLAAGLIVVVSISSQAKSVQPSSITTELHHDPSSLLRQDGQRAVCEPTNDPKKPRMRHNITTFDPPLPIHHELSDFLEGPALKPEIRYSNAHHIAACKFNPDNHSAHFPHALQQVYRCVSWWQDHRHRQGPQALTNTSSSSSRVELFLVWPKQAPRSSPFLSGLLHALRNVWGLRVVPLRGNVPVVRAQVAYGYDSAATNKNHKVGFVTRRPGDLQTLREDLVREYAPPRYQQEVVWGLASSERRGDETPQRASSLLPHKPTITILNRHVDSGRFLLNAPELLQAIQQQFSRTAGAIQLVDSFDQKTFQEQLNVISHTDILISPHGAQLSSLFLMPKCSAVLELFGRGYSCPEYFGSLAAASGVRYHHLYTGGANMTDELQYWMKDLESRNVARLFPMCAPQDVVLEYLVQEVEAWYQRVQNPTEQCL